MCTKQLKIRWEDIYAQWVEDEASDLFLRSTEEKNEKMFSEAAVNA